MRLEENLNDNTNFKNIFTYHNCIHELVKTMCGEFLGDGSTRMVFDYNLDSRYVIKLEKYNTNCNYNEYQMWDEIKGLSGKYAWVKDWFAPCGWISPNGKIMTMRKTKVIDSREKPKKLPRFLWDIKEENFGWIGKNFVSHDYGQIHAFTDYKKEFRKIDWSLNSLHKY